MKNPATVITVDENGEQTQTTVEAEKINKQSAGKKDKKKDKKKTKKAVTRKLRQLQKTISNK